MCIFCQIIKNEIPSHKIMESDLCLSFLDIAPVNPGHLLVIPKDHYINMEEIPENVLFDLIIMVKRAGALLKEKLGVAGYNIIENNDPVAGQEIPHVHFHVIPRKEDDGIKLWPQGSYLPGEAEDIARRLKN
jgi:histidine triad (HIT) family protein